MHPDLERLETELAYALAGLDEQQTRFRSKQPRPKPDPVPDQDRWSIQQIAEHLRLTYLATVVAVEARIARGTPTRARPSLLQRAAQLTVTRVGFFPRGRRAPPPVCPASTLPSASGGAVGAALATQITRMDAQLTQAEQTFGSRRRSISHMILGPLSIAQWRRFHLIHGRHHIRQIEAIRREHGLKR
jgi:hypothetical protein